MRSRSIASASIMAYLTARPFPCRAASRLKPRVALRSDEVMIVSAEQHNALILIRYRSGFFQPPPWTIVLIAFMLLIVETSHSSMFDLPRSPSGPRVLRSNDSDFVFHVIRFREFPAE